MSHRGNSSKSGSFGGRNPNQIDSNSGHKTFSMNAVPPPPSLMGRSNPFQKHNPFAKPNLLLQQKQQQHSQLQQQPSYPTMDTLSQFGNTSQYGIGKRKSKTEDEYFDDDDETPASSDLAYIPSPGSPAFQKKDVILVFLHFSLKYL